MRRPYTQSLLLFAYQASARELTQHLHEHGHTAVRAKHGAVFANIDRGGTRASVLARRAGIGRPAMGELIDELERLGYVERRPDPGDRRAKLVVPTPAAIELTRIVHELNRRLEARYRRKLGSADYATFRSALETLAGRDDAQPRIGYPPARTRPDS